MASEIPPKLSETERANAATRIGESLGVEIDSEIA
jgi:hypothetical protein